MFQSPVLLEWRTAIENIMLQAEARKLDRRAAEARARDLLAAVGLAGFEHKYPPVQALIRTCLATSSTISRERGARRREFGGAGFGAINNMAVLPEGAA